MKRKDKLVIWRNETTGQWYWHLQSTYNGYVKASGQSSGFSSKAKAKAGWEAVAGSAKAGVEVVYV